MVARLVALVRPLLPEDWFSEAGERFRETTGKISHFTKEQHITPSEVAEEAVSLGRRRLEGEADEKRSKAAREFAAAENLNSGYPLYSSWGTGAWQ